MTMLKSIKTGFGFVIGTTLAYATLGFIKHEVMTWGAKDEKFMEYEKEHNPEMYEKLSKYQ